MKWNARWIWHPAREKLDNFYLHARKAFTLEGVPERVKLFVTAGNLYKLYINGQFVGQGPNPSDPSYYYFDVYEVDKLLRPGPNVVAATCYHYSDQPVGIIKQNWGPGGLLLEMRSGDEKVLLASDDSWRLLHAPEWDQSTLMSSPFFGDYKETYDSRREVPGWRQAEFDDGQWIRPLVLGQPPLDPYLRLVEREIPFLGGDRVAPVNAYIESASVTYAWRQDCEIHHEQRLIPGQQEDLSNKPVEILKTHPDFSPAILLDFGRLVTGHPQISIVNSAGGTIDVLYGEDLKLVRTDRFILKGGPQVLQPYNRRTFRYMKLVFPDTPQRIEVDRVSLDMNTYPVQYQGEFCCSDGRLNRIWEVGRYTIHLSMLDHFVDCPWRERTVYGGDLYVENLVAAYAFGDPRLNRKTLRQMFAIQYPQGALPPFGPYRGCGGFYPSWTAFFGLAFLDHYWLSGDRQFLEELWPQLTRLLDWAVREIQTNTPHLIGNPAQGGNFEKWSSQPKVVFGAWDSLPFYLLLRRSALLARKLNHEAQTQRYAQAADMMTAAIHQHLLNGSGGIAADHAQGPSHRRTQADAAYLLWSQVLDPAQGAALVDAALLPGVEPISTPFLGLLLVEGVYGYRQDHQALEFIRTYWGELLARGATTFWEHFSLAWRQDRRAQLGGSLCHGWSAGPTYSLPAHVLGVQPLEPGFAKVLIEPRPADLTWARGKVPTPQGLITVKWTRAGAGGGAGFHMSVDLPATCPATVSLSAQLYAGVTVDGAPVATQTRNGRVLFDIGSGRHEILYR